MTLSQIMRGALLMLGEDPEDIGEYEERFTGYANMGYRIAWQQYIKPREIAEIGIDGRGFAWVDRKDVRRIIEVMTLGDCPRRLQWTMAADGRGLWTDARGCRAAMLYELILPDMREGSDEPRLPETAQTALCDYICYRHLSSGSLTKQSQAKFYRNSFYEAMGQLSPEGYGSVRKMKNLYEATGM